MDKNKLKEVLKTIVTEESEYKEFFKRALEKAGKSIPSMSDEEKKAFFNKIDAAWDARGEKNEELTGNQHKLDVDGDGEIEASDLAKLRAKKNESVNEEIKVGSSVTVNYPTLKKPVTGKVKHILKSPTGLVYVLDGDKGVWDAKNVSLKESVKEGEDIDVGHTDDEPNMLKSTAHEIAEYASRLIEKLDQYDNMSQEVDFPNWWQAKLILAKDYVSGAFHYLDSKETLGEGRAFINAARKAKTEGKKEFEFNGKTYPVTIKD